MSFDTLYNPAAQSEDWLIEHFVVRTKVFAQIFGDIKNARMQHAEQHYLVQGQRGMGKTTLLLRLKYEVERTPELKARLLPVFFSEESYDLVSLSNLWEKLLKYFDRHLPGGGGYYRQTDAFMGRDDYEQRCFDLVLNVLQQQQKKLILFFDNFGELFLDHLDERESHRFREILMNCAEIRIIGASAVVLESHNNYHEPFFDFFRIINLKGLNRNETIDLIRKLQEKSEHKIDVEASKARIETLAVLTGGVIRTIMMLYAILLDDPDGRALAGLEKILDKVTPLYKHRMDDLKPQQRRIVDAIAKHWDAISTAELSATIRERGKPVPSKVISAQLQELERNNIIEKKKTSTKNNLYQLRERFFNIWYLMRHGDATTQCKVKWLTRYLEMWYGDREGGLDEFVQGHVLKLQSGRYLESAALMIVNALLDSPKINFEAQAALLKATRNSLAEHAMDKMPADEQAIGAELKRCHAEKNPAKRLQLLQHLGVKNRAVYFLIGLCHYEMGELEAALPYIQKNYLPNEPTHNVLLGTLLMQLSNYAEAPPYLIKALSLGKKDAANQERFSFIIYGALNICYYFTKAGDEKVIDCTEKALQYSYEADILITTKGFKTLQSFAAAIKMSIISDDPGRVNECFQLAELVVTNGYLPGVSEFVLIFFAVNDQFDRILPLFAQFENAERRLNDINDVLMLLIQRKQYHLTLQIFNDERLNLKNLLKPTYYALLYFLRDELPDEYLKKGSELDDPVQEVVARIQAEPIISYVKVSRDFKFL